MAIEIITVPEQEIIPPHRGKKPAGKTWSDIIANVTNMTAAEASEYFGQLANSGKYPVGITLKEIMVARAIEDFLEKPNSAIWNTMMDRAEGRVADTVNVHQITDVEISIKRKEDNATSTSLGDSGEVVPGRLGTGDKETS